MFDTADVCAEARYIINAMHGASKIKGREREKVSPTGHRFKVCLCERNVCEGGKNKLNWLIVAVNVLQLCGYQLYIVCAY